MLGNTEIIGHLGGYALYAPVKEQEVHQNGGADRQGPARQGKLQRGRGTQRRQVGQGGQRGQAYQRGQGGRKNKGGRRGRRGLWRRKGTRGDKQLKSVRQKSALER